MDLGSPWERFCARSIRPRLWTLALGLWTRVPRPPRQLRLKKRILGCRLPRGVPNISQHLSAANNLAREEFPARPTANAVTTQTASFVELVNAFEIVRLLDDVVHHHGKELLVRHPGQTLPYQSGWAHLT